MNYTEKIAQLQTGIEILEAMKHFEVMIKHTEKSIQALHNWFPELEAKYKHQIVIYKMCITRLKERYLRNLSNV